MKQTEALMNNLMKTIKSAVLVVATMVAHPSSATGDATASPPNPQKADKTLEEQVLGYWAPDSEAMADKWKPMLKGLAELSLGDRSEKGLAEAEKKATEEIKEGCRVTTFEVTKDSYLQHTGPGRVEKQGYVVKRVDAKTGTIEVELTSSHGGKPTRGKLVLAGERLTITELPEEQSVPWILVRVDKREYEKREAAAAESSLFKDTGIKFKEPQEPQPSPTQPTKKPAKSKP